MIRNCKSKQRDSYYNSSGRHFKEQDGNKSQKLKRKKKELEEETQTSY